MHRILLVEDNVDSRAVYRLMLEHAGFRVLEATDGEAGVRCAREERPDLILMDVEMPRLDGWEATRILKADLATRDIPILILTAHALAADHVQARAVGGDGYLPKPMTPRQVVEEVHRHLGIAEPGYPMG